MHRYGTLSYFQLLGGVGFMLGMVTQYKGFHKVLFSTLLCIALTVFSVIQNLLVDMSFDQNLLVNSVF